MPGQVQLPHGGQRCTLPLTLRSRACQGQSTGGAHVKDFTWERGKVGEEGSADLRIGSSRDWCSMSWLQLWSAVRGLSRTWGLEEHLTLSERWLGPTCSFGGHKEFGEIHVGLGKYGAWDSTLHSRIGGDRVPDAPCLTP